MATPSLDIESRLRFLRSVSIFSTLKPDEAQKVAEAMSSEKFSPGETIITEGELGQRLFVIERGEVVFSKGGEVVNENGGCRDYFGEIALLTNEPRLATVRAVEETQCFVITRAQIRELLGPIEEVLKRRLGVYRKYVEQQRVHYLLLREGVFAPALVEKEVSWFYGGLGLHDYYYTMTTPETTARHISALLAAKVLAAGGDGVKAQESVKLVQEEEDRAFFAVRSSVNVKHTRGAKMENASRATQKLTSVQEVERRFENEYIGCVDKPVDFSS